MKLIVGLGNPGKKYEKTRHNSGYFVMDLLAKELNVKLDKEKWKALYCQTKIDGEDVILLKPLTFMNDSGQSVKEVVKKYDIEPEEILVIHDDIDLPPGAVRIRPSGGSAGQKGMQSIIDMLGTNEIPRIRIGVGHSEGHDHDLVPDWVLSPLSKEEQEEYEIAISVAKDAARAWISQDMENVMTQYNRRIRKEKEEA